MSWLFSQALVAEYSADTCSDGEPSAPLSVMPTQHKFWHRDKTMEFSDLSRFGLTCAVLTESRGAELLTLFLAGFPARTLALQEKALESKESAVGCGNNLGESFAKWNPEKSMWKIRQLSLFGDLEQSLATWPTWGLMQNGECWGVTQSEPVIEDTGFGFVPTPTASDYKGGAKNGRDSEFKHWLKRRHGGTYPHPLCVEEMMLWPTGWINLEPLETGKFQQWRQQHSEFYQESDAA